MPHPTIVSRDRPGGRRLSQRAGLQRARRVGLRRRDAADSRRSTSSSSRSIDLIETYHNLTAQERARELPRRAAGARHGAEPVQRRLPAARAARAWPRTLFWAICRKLQQHRAADGRRARGAAEPRRVALGHLLLQLLAVPVDPDSWAIKQLFPIMPIHRLNERPTQHAVLGDITCDSDGKIDQFIDRRDVKKTLPLHPFNGEPYYLGVVPGRRLPGDPRRPAQPVRRHHAVHVSLDENGNVVLDAVIKGDTVREVLDYVEFDAETLTEPAARRTSRRAVRDGRMDLRAVRPAAAVLRGRAARLHVPGGCARG